MQINEGLLLIDKPSDISSFGVVARIRRVSDINKVGHAGTLDPLATGLLIVLVGKKYTQQAQTLLKQDKTYEVELTLGKVSESGDGEGPIQTFSIAKPTKVEVVAVLKQFVGQIDQTPPIHSAIKVNGKRAYQLARAGENIQLKPRKTTIYSINEVSYSYPNISFTVRVSSGTYIRSLATDIGAKLGCGAYLSKLRRTQIGEYRLTDAIPLEKITQS